MNRPILDATTYQNDRSVVTVRPLDIPRPLDAQAARLQRLVDLAMQIERELLMGQDLGEFKIIGREWRGALPVVTFKLPEGKAA